MDPDPGKRKEDDESMNTLETVIRTWTPHAPSEEVICGDMPGDSVRIGEEHIRKACILMPELFPLLSKKLEENHGRAVISVFGGSGVGKSEIASLIACYLREAGIGAYTLSGDNYPRRIPKYNDAERLRIFRVEGLHGLLAGGLYSADVREALSELWKSGSDSDPAAAEGRSWLSAYQQAGRRALAAYLGQDAEQDYEELRAVVDRFHAGEQRIWLKRMGRNEEALWYDEVDFSHTEVLIIEWTHGGSGRFGKVDLPILLASTPAETREHRRARARDAGTDSAFTTMVLEIEQTMIEQRASSAALIISKAGRLITLEEYTQAMKAGR